MMIFGKFLVTLFLILYITGCSARTKDFFENIYSSTEVRSANDVDYGGSATKNSSLKEAPIVRLDEDRRKVKKSRESLSDKPRIYTATGRITHSSYDRDLNLYIFTFEESGSLTPISFYYDRDIKPIGDIVTIQIKDNYLLDISHEGGKLKNIDEINKKTRNINKPHVIHHRRWRKRKRSNIQAPFEEKINTL